MILADETWKARFKPRVGGRDGEVPAERPVRFRESVLAKVPRRLFGRLGGGSSGRASTHVRTIGADAQRCILKAHVHKIAGDALALRRHLDYIEREGVELDGSPGRLYGSVESEAPREELTSPSPAEKHQFRFIVSPEQSSDLDLRVFVRRFVSEVERDMGTRVIWGAVNHYDTDQPHAHIVIRGIDREGKQLRFDRRYISESMRLRAQHILTEELGPRRARDIDRQAIREREQARLTTLDRELAKQLAGEAVLNMQKLAALSSARRENLLARLVTLAELGVVESRGPGSWLFTPGWQDTLRALGSRGDVLKRIHLAMRGQGDPARYLVADGSNIPEPVVGIVRRKGLHNQETGETYAIVEAENGRAYYLRVEGREFDSLREGALVRVEVKAERWLKPMDRVLYEASRESAGVYDSRVHLGQLKARSTAIGGQPVAAGDVVAANSRRLGRLERYGLVMRLDAGRWQIPPDFLKRLEEREVTHPRTRAQIARIADSLDADVHYRGPAWIDTRASGLPEGRAHYGFGAEVSAASARRAEVLRGFGIGDGEASPAALNRLERDSVASKLTADTGCDTTTTLPSSASIVGRVFACERTSSGAELVRVVDEKTRRALLVPRAALRGIGFDKAVRVTSDSKGRLFIAALDIGEEGS